MKAEGNIRRCNICSQPVDRIEHLRWRKDGYEILECPTCGTLFRADLPTPAELTEIYGPDYFADISATGAGRGYSDYLGEEINHRANAAARMQLLERYHPVASLLDVGSAAGFFLDEARKRGWRVEGVELAVDMAHYARNRLGLEVHASPFEDADVKPNVFDVITMWDYLEHSLDPARDLRKAASLLRQNGLLAISTGDAGSIPAKVFRSRWHLLTPRHHNFFFTRRSLERAFQDAGFEVVLMKYASSRYSPHYLVHKLQTLTDWPVLPRLARQVQRTSLGRRGIPVNLFDIVTVIGRKN